MTDVPVVGEGARDAGTGVSVDTPKIMKGYEGVSLTP